MMKEKIVPLLVIGGLIMGVYLMFSGGSKQHSAGIEVKIPVLSASATSGQAIFKINCSQCHGPSAGGTTQGPPLIHKYYEASHHADGAFYRAATMGVRAHHWRFGNMPPIRTVTTQDVSKIIAFVREVQKANGIF
ncbi:MAG: cytochrome c [bacterium]|nr:cytochrome c [bacterium]